MNLPNPLEINFGTGKIGLRRFQNPGDGKKGLVLVDTAGEHDVGSYSGVPEAEHEPKEGEIYLSFASSDSIKVVIEELLKLL